MNRITATFLCLMLCLAGTSLHATAFAAEQTSVSAPSAPSPVTPAQVVALKTPVVPAPLVRPFPAPVTTRTVTVPTSIDATGTTEVSAALNLFIESVPDGSIISFPTGATYKLDEGIQFANRHNLIFEGNGTTLQVSATASGDNTLTSLFSVGYLYTHSWHGGCTDIVIHDFILIGNSPTPGVFHGDSQHQHGMKASDFTRLEIYNVTGSALHGDFVDASNASGLWVHGCHVITAGRNGFSAEMSDSDVLVENCAFDACGWCTLDIEPHDNTNACSNIVFRNNTVRTWGNYFSVVVPFNTGATIDGVVIDGNTVTGGSLKTGVGLGGTTRMTRISFTNNKGTVAAGTALTFAHVDGLTVTGNVQPLSSGVLASITDSTEVGTP